MKYVLYSVLFLFSFSLCAQKHNKYGGENPNSSAELRLEALEHQLLSISTKNDSLNRELYFYRSKEDQYLGLYQSAISHYDAILGIIVALILAGIPVIIYFTFSTLSYNLKRQKIELDRHIAKTKEETVFLKWDVYGYVATSIMQTAILYKDRNSGHDGLDMMLHAFEAVFKSYKAYGLRDGDSKIIFTYLDKINHQFDRIPPSNWGDPTVVKYYQDIYEKICKVDGEDIFLEFCKFDDGELSGKALDVYSKFFNALYRGFSTK